MNKCVEDSPAHQKKNKNKTKNKQTKKQTKPLVLKDNYSLTKVVMESTSQNPVFVSGELRPDPESYALLLWRAQFPHASYPREELFDKFLRWLVAVYKSFL